MEVIKLRKEAIFWPMLTTSLLINTWAAMAGEKQNLVLAALTGTLGLTALWIGAISCRKRLKKLEEQLT